MSSVVRHVEKVNDLDDEVLLSRINEIVGEDNVPDIEGGDVKTFYKYLLQNTIKYQITSEENVGDLIMITGKDVERFNREYEWTKVDGTTTSTVRQEKPKKVTKKDQAEKIFAEHYGKLKPKEIKQMFMDELDMTKLGANTYYYTLKSETDKKSK
jgi:hypothetical protein